MNWTKDKSIALSRVCVAGFALLLAAVDVFVWLRRLRVYRSELFGISPVLTDWGIILISLFAWPALWALWHLLGNLKEEKVFTSENVHLLRVVSWCCVGAALVCGIAAWVGIYRVPPLVSLLFLVMAAAAAFMALIVRIVKNVFQQAIAMKSELDLTV